MSEVTDVIMSAIRSAFESYPKEGDPDWRSPSWIMPEECAHLTNVILRDLEARGFHGDSVGPRNHTGKDI